MAFSTRARALAAALFLPLSACVETVGLEDPDRYEGCSLRPISIGEAIPANLTTLDCVMQDGSGAYADYFELRVFNTTYVDITMESTTLDPYLLILDEDDYVIAEDDDSLGGLDAWIRVKLSPGTYYIAASTYTAQETGSYLLAVELPPTS